jgi:hypothetical protein
MAARINPQQAVVIRTLMIPTTLVTMLICPVDTAFRYAVLGYTMEKMVEATLDRKRITIAMTVNSETFGIFFHLTIARISPTSQAIYNGICNARVIRVADRYVSMNIFPFLDLLPVDRHQGDIIILGRAGLICLQAAPESVTSLLPAAPPGF